MTSRRRFVIAGALSALAFRHAAAQRRLSRIGIMSGVPLAQSIYGGVLVRKLAEAGYRDGVGATLEYRSADGRPDRNVTHANELVDLKCDVIFALGSDLPVRALIDLGTPVPTVFWAGDYDPVEKGFLRNLRRPENNVTGVYAPQAALVAKRLELLRELLPRARRFLLLADPWSRDHIGAAQKAAELVRAQLTVVEFSQQPYDFAAAIASAAQSGAEGVVVLNSPAFSANRVELSGLMVKHGLPSVGAGLPGVLLSYYTDLQKAADRVAAIGVRILRGARPEEIPVEQSDEFQFVVNMRIARALRLEIPRSVAARATRFIE